MSNLATDNHASASLPDPHPATAVHAWVRATPHAVAVRDPHREVTYRELWQQARGWAEVVTEAVSGPEPLVAVLHPRDAALPAIQLGIWLAGAAYLPVDPALPQARVDQIVSQAGCAAVLTTEHLATWVPGHVIRTRPAVLADDSGDGWSDRLGQLAYVIYTSGSTGAPKGVEVEHAGLSRLLAWYGERFGFGPGVNIAMLAGLGFDQTVLDVWGTLTTGATLVIPPPGPLAADTDALVTFLDAAEAHHTYLPTAVAEQIFAGDRWPKTLRSMDVGGEQLRAWPPADFPIAVHNGYGPTETTVLATLSDDLRALVATGLPPIGDPVADLSLVLVDEHGNPVDDGHEGELLIGGTGVARGYRNDPAQTRDGFVVRDGRRWYRTGDICRRSGDALLFVGRRDGQVKIRGHRIELGEIEQLLLSRPGVAQAAVVVADVGSGRALHAFVAGPADPVALRDDLVAALPAAMVPSTVRSLPHLPSTTNGKVDRRALEAHVHADVSATVAEPDRVNPMEHVVAAVWAEVLGRHPDREDDFFAVGGQSLTAAQVTARLRKLLGVQIPLSTLFEHPRLRTYATVIDRTRQSTQGAPPEGPRRIPRRTSYEPSLTQSHRLTKELRAARRGLPRPLMLVPLVVEIRGPVSDRALEDALDAVTRRHESLRTGFSLDAAAGGGSVFIVDELPVELPVVALPGVAPSERLAAVTALQRDLERQVLDLAAPPLWRAVLCRFADDHAVLVLAFDHLLMDGWATDVFFAELCSALEGAATDDVSEVLQHVDWAAWQRSTVTAEASQRLGRYWADALRGTKPYPALPLPVPAEVRPPGREVVRLQLDPSRTRRLSAASDGRGATLLMAILHAVSVGWYVATGQSDVVIHTPTANRSLPEFERLMGWLAHLVHVRLRTDPELDLGAGLGQVRAAMLEALLHQDLPHPLVVQALQPEAHGRPRRKERLFVAFAPSPPPARQVGSARLSVIPTGDHAPVAEPGLSVYAGVEDECLHIQFVADPSTVEPSFLAQLRDLVAAALEATSATPDRTPADLAAESIAPVSA